MRSISVTILLFVCVSSFGQRVKEPGSTSIKDSALGKSDTVRVPLNEFLKEHQQKKILDLENQIRQLQKEESDYFQIIFEDRYDPKKYKYIFENNKIVIIKL